MRTLLPIFFIISLLFVPQVQAQDPKGSPVVSADMIDIESDHLEVDTQKGQAVFTGNVGCLLQVMRYLRKEGPDVWVAHPVDALWASYSGKIPGRQKARAARS